MQFIDCFGITEVGRVRVANEDQFLIADLSKSLTVLQTSLGPPHRDQLFGNMHGKLFVVADGLGGHAAGERASLIAVDSILNFVLNTLPWFFHLDPQGEKDLADELKAALDQCQVNIRVDVAAQPRHAGMATTVTLAYVLWPRLFVVHAGDSRCYLQRGAHLRQITKDQTMAQQFVDSGQLRPEDAETSRWSHVLWNVVGGDSDNLQAEVYKAELREGDTLLLCSDGLTKHLTDEQLSEVLESDEDSSSACRRLVAAANAAGGSDNITVILARFLAMPPDDDLSILAVEDATPAPSDTVSIVPTDERTD